jgi:hypothetical protein
MVNGDRQLAAARLQPAIEVHEATLAGEVFAPEQWVVIVNYHDEPTAALAPGEAARFAPIKPLGDLVASLPGIILAGLDTTFQAVVDLADANEMRNAPVVVLDYDGVVGCATAADLARQLFSIRYGSSATGLPGPITVPKLVRHCRYIEKYVSCGWTQRFTKHPAQMPPCPNPRVLTDHDFVW